MKKTYLIVTTLLILFLVNSCKEDEKIVDPITTDISVVSSEKFIYWLNDKDLFAKLDYALTYNYGNALEEDIQKEITFNTDSTKVTATIDFKYHGKYLDANKRNNSIIISLEKILAETGCFSISEEEYLRIPYKELPAGAGEDLEEYWDFADLMPPVGNQGRSESCVGWAVGYYLKSYQEKIEGNYNYTSSTIMSPNYIWNQIKVTNFFFSCGGSFFKDAFEILKSQGICSYKSMPFSTKCSTKPNAEQIKEASKNKIRGYYRLKMSSDIVSEIKYYLSKNIPIVIGIKIDSDFKNKNNINYEYIYKGLKKNSQGKHALVLVGYDDRKGAMLAVNSYGKQWGNEGFCWISYKLFTDSKNTVSEAYWAEDIVKKRESKIKLSGDINFGYLPVNTASETKNLTVYNMGNKSLNITDITSTNSAFKIFGKSTVVKPNSSTNIEVQFKPIKEENYSATITVESNADVVENNTINVTGIGVDNNSDQSKISLSGNLNFGEIEIGEESQKTFTISNTGDKSFNVTGFISSNSAFKIFGKSAVVKPNSSTNIEVQFKPIEEENYSATITVESNADVVESNTIKATGVGINNNSDQSKISLSGNLNFGEVEIGEESQRSFTISNTGDKSFNVTDIDLPSDVYYTNWSSGVIQGGKSKEVIVTFAPKSNESYNGTVYVNNDADEGDGNIVISGRGVSNNKFSDLIVESIWLKDRGNNKYDINTRLKNIGSEATPNDEDIEIKYYVNNKLVDVKETTYLEPNEVVNKYLRGYKFTKSGKYNVRVEITPVSNENNTSNNSLERSEYVEVDEEDDDTPISIKPSDSCKDAPEMKVNTVYEVNVDIDDYTPGNPIDGESKDGAKVKGFWLKFEAPSNWKGQHQVKIFDVSSKFNPVIGIKASCKSTYLAELDEYNSGSNEFPLFENDRKKGGNETFDTNIGNGDYYIRIYHYNGNETPYISFKIKVE